jgi:hypothetical protein
MKRALEDAAYRSFPGIVVDRNGFFREFVKAVRRKCSTWERVPNSYIRGD